MVRGGRVGAAVLQPAQVTAGGDFTHWTAGATPGLFSPAAAVDWASGAGRVIAMMPHTGPDGSPNIVDRSSLPVDGIGCVGTIITDVGLIRVTRDGLVLAELAPGWTADAVAAITGAPLQAASGLREMSFDIPGLEPPNKVFTAREAVRDVPDGAVVNIDGFAGPGGMAHYLLLALRDQGAKDLTMISNTAGIARVVNFGTPPGRLAIDQSVLVDNNQVKKSISSFPVSPRASQPSSFELAFQRGEVELELVPQGTLAERLRAGGTGVAAFYTPTAAGTLLAEGKETRVIDGKEYVLETGLTADFCLIRGHKADTLGNVVYKGTSRNFNPVMATASRITVMEVDEIVEPGALSPEEIVTPGIYVDRIVKRPAGFSAYQ
jgi:3-oxoacid CoA-transferase A subunit